LSSSPFWFQSSSDWALLISLPASVVPTGLGRAVHLRQRASLWWVHLCWTATVFLYLALHWWNLFFLNDGSTWSFLAFIYVLLHSVLLFFLAILLYRPDPDGALDLRATFETNRSWFLGVFAATVLVDIGTTAIQDNLFNPWHYLPMTILLAVLAVVGALTPNPRYQQFLAIYFLVWFFGWSVLVRGLLPAAA
jgi:hypothetical protein